MLIIFNELWTDTLFVPLESCDQWCDGIPKYILLFKNLTNKMTTVIMERPYILGKIIDDLNTVTDKRVLNKKRFAFVIDIDNENTQIIRGTLSKIREEIPKNLKAPFILIIEK